ncbi:oxygen-independent coproporphyrinogen III oxidase, partial [Simkania negevensis]|nr:oxygen-independent coproporphyrinogen III oxidase [Simkania negevensis]
MTSAMLRAEQLMEYDKPVPRYTSYPTAPEWHDVQPTLYSDHLTRFDQQQQPLSLYFHIPFCKTMCLYCGCSVVLNRKSENETYYVDHLIKEVELVASHFKRPHPITQLHFGGGTPTKLNEQELTRLFSAITSSFAIDWTGEIAIEIDPRTVAADGGKKLSSLRSLGFNRVSFGVQDTDPTVQEAVKRRQSFAMTKQTYEWARELGFQGINIDLIYGLPYQTTATFTKTVDDILSLKPDRIALFSYAKIPWLKPHQKAIPENTLPSTQEKFEIYCMAREQFTANGYVAIGMDHFALADDDLAKAFYNKTLQRNFQGYSLQLAENALGLGVTS